MDQPFNAVNIVDENGFITGGHVLVPGDNVALMMFDWTNIDVETLLAIAYNRLTAYQESPTICGETDSALAHLKTAMWYLNSRAKRRVAEGTYGSHMLDDDAAARAAEYEASKIFLDEIHTIL